MKNRYLVFRLSPGEDIYQGIIKNCVENRVKAASVVSAVGSIKELHLRKADGCSEYYEKNYFEVTSLSGTISEDGPHIHIQLSDVNLRSIGGHLLQGTIVHTTMEIVILNLEEEYNMKRSFDEATGYDELEVIKK